jgi:hypothetical protein
MFRGCTSYLFALLVKVGRPFLLRVFVEFGHKVSAEAEVQVEVERCVGDLRRSDGKRLGAHEVIPTGLRRCSEVGPRATLLKRQPARLHAHGVLVEVPRAVLLKRKGELPRVLLVLFRVHARERHNGVEGNGLNGLEKGQATQRVKEVGEAVLASAMNAALDLVRPPETVAIGALQNEAADVS